ncbi:MAG: phage major capsid protein, partial [Candidatus Bathyarchaeota archaeon]|nr:phage major capsid protein [Candidatus Bathyarchaeota archaeon]
DALSTPDASILIGKVVSNIVKEAIEPLLVGTSLLHTIRFSAGQQITFPAAGAFTAEDIPEGGEYPERKLEVAGTVTAFIGKSGVKVRITDEMLRYSQYDVMSMHIRAAGRALARHKETKIFNMIRTEGVTTFDNNVVNKQTSGRASDGTGNGTITLDDLLVMYSKVVSNGFVPNALLMSPLGWLLFSRDPILRAFGFANGGPMFGPMQGQPGVARSWYQGGMNVGPVASAPYAATTYANVPNMFPSPLRVIVSPFLSYTAASGQTAAKTDIIMADTNELGIIVIDEDVTNEEWDDPNRDIRTIKFRERYGLGILNEGKAISVAKNISITKAYDLEDRIRWQAGSGALPTVNQAGV